MSSIGESYIGFYGNNENNCINFQFNGNAFNQEKAIVIAEVYKKNDIWRLSIASNGFDGGLAALLTFFGGESAKEDEDEVSKTSSENATSAISAVTSNKPAQCKRPAITKKPKSIKN